MIHSDEVRSLSRALVQAADDRIRRAVAMIDAMPVRGAADALVAPLRSRLARLRPARPLNFTRLLFLPLDPVIVPIGAWRSGGAGVPRPALAPLSQAVRRDWPGIDTIDARLAALTTADLDQVRDVAIRLWADAVPRLLTATPPAHWREATGLAAEDHMPIARGVALVLAQGAGVLRPAEDPTELCRGGLAVQAEFIRTAPAGTVADMAPLATFLAVLMLRAPRAGRVLAALEDLAAADSLGADDRPLPVAGQMALDFVLAGMVRDAASGTLSQAAALIDRAVAVLADLDSLPESSSALRQHLVEVRQALDVACRARFETALQEMLQPALGPAERESLAREVSRFDQAARQVGGADSYDERRREALARLAELLAGGERQPSG